MIKSFPIEINKCPNCQSQAMIGAMAAEVLGATPEEAKVHSVRQTISVKQNPRAAAGITVPALVLSYEICADCGFEFVHRAAITQMPITTPSPRLGPMWPPHPFGKG